jgi:nitroreductase
MRFGNHFFRLLIVWAGVIIIGTQIFNPVVFGQAQPKSDSKEVTMDTCKIEAVFETIRTRRTVREFDGSSVPEEHVTQILDMARYAPTAGNVQPWKFVVIQNPKTLAALKDSLKSWWKTKVIARQLGEEKERDYIEGGKEQIDKIMTAPVYVLVLVDTTVYPEYALYDGCLAVENLMLAARALGYGTGFFTTFFPEEKVCAFVGAPKNYKFICATPIGRPPKWPSMPEKKPLEEFIVREHF